MIPEIPADRGKGGGCSGMSYILDFEAEKVIMTKYFEIEGIPMVSLICSQHLPGKDMEVNWKVAQLKRVYV